ncbi:winged helix-turn-helix domain-containing protein [Serinicoccus sediminis]|uniref:winged helix-turn-helix domain-containing protein n=1 Tax=Serinicoccus sediminis TaxID=2306021 RepID=UPI00101F8960|nr:winged helix-turn-helix domain-containing protein [Serinicoccus sediminis]
MTQPFWIVPLETSPAEVAATLAACEESRILGEVVPAAAIRDRLSTARPPAVVLQGGEPSPSLVDAQRWLAEAGVPTLVLLPTLTDDLEAVLLDRGAQDVLQLPVSSRRLGARLRLLTRAPAGQREEPVDIRLRGDVTLSPGRRTVRVGDAPVPLTRSEFDLLLTVVLAGGSVVDHHDLAQALRHDTLSTQALQTHASRVRSKLRAAGAPDVLRPVRGIGYRLTG